MTQTDKRRIPPRWWVFIAVLVMVSLGALVFEKMQPSELEKEIQMGLVTTKVVEESARVTVMEAFDLKSLHNTHNAWNFSLVRIAEENRCFLACLRSRGGMWLGSRDNWIELSGRTPTSKEAEEFRKVRDELIERYAHNGYREYPAEHSDFRIKRLTIKISADGVSETQNENFDPNEGIDPEKFAALLRHEGTVLASAKFNPYTFAPFHSAKWFSAGELVESLGKYIGRRKIPDFDDITSDESLETLNAVAARLTEISDRQLGFYLLAEE